MGFFRQVGNALVRFMYGRNGVDQLNVALLWGYLLAAVLRIIQAMTLQLAILDVLLDVVQLVMLAVMVFRRAIPQTLPLLVPEAADATAAIQIEAIVNCLETFRA